MSRFCSLAKLNAQRTPCTVEALVGVAGAAVELVRRRRQRVVQAARLPVLRAERAPHRSGARLLGHALVRPLGRVPEARRDALRRRVCLSITIKVPD